MYEETAYFDPNGNIMLDGVRTELHLPHEVMGEAAAASRTNSHSGGGGCDDDGHTAVDLRIPSIEQGRAASAIEIELERQLQMDMQQYSQQNLDENQLYVIQQQQIIHQQQQQQQQQLDDPDQIARPLDDQSNWEQVGMQNVNQHQHQNHQMFNSPLSHPHPTADLLNLFHLPNPSLSYAAAAVIDNNNNASSSVMYDPLFHLNLPPQPPMFRDLFQSNGYSLTGSRLGSSIFGDDGEASGGVVYQGGDSGILEFAAAEVARGRGRNGKANPNFTTDRHRRNHMSNKYQALKDLVPNPTKNDRASIVQDAIEYIHEQMRTVKELKILVEKKRCSRDKRKRHRTGDDHGGESNNNAKNGDGGGGGGDSTDQYYNGALLSSWIQRKTKDTEVDVRIIDDDVTIKLVQRKKMNCLLLVSKFLDELHLDLQHVAGGHIGDFYSFLFNAKIYEGSSLYASAIANKLIEVVDKQYAAAPSNFSSSY